MATLIDGPAWSAPGLDIRAGRYPLSVERHVMRMADLLVPGVTTVTPHARYFALHGLIAEEAIVRGLSASDAQDLLRRAEVALAVVSYSHDHVDSGLPRAHGTDALARRLHTGEVDMTEASTPGPGGYVRNKWGFWNPYAASEVALQILAPGSIPTPGEACAPQAIRAGLGGLLELARQRSLAVADVSGRVEFCVCQGGQAADGRWLARLLCSEDVSQRGGLRSRQETIRMLARLMETHDVRAISADIFPLLAYGDFVMTDAVAEGLAATAVWRGVVLRNYAVGAWRRIWSWMVEQVDGLMPADELIDRFVSCFPAETVGSFLGGLPATTTATGAPAPAELALRGGTLPLPLCELSVLAVGARRIDELTGRVLDAFVGQRGVELGPEWMSRRLAASGAAGLRDFARQLATDLLIRARRIALSKAQANEDGSLWLPARLHERGDVLYRTSLEGRGDVGLRLDQLTTVLAGAGVFQRIHGLWRVTRAGRDLLG
jgi:hypothetical protein